MSYPDSVRYLYALGNELKAGAKLGLERINALLAQLGHPEQNLRIVHVAGTNGKGSACAMIASVCRAAGLRTGLYTSPHLTSPTERISLNGAPVSETAFAALFEKVHRIAEEMLEAGQLDAHPSYFETVTAMAFEAFRHTDIVVLEVGLGGRLDATNVVTPELTVITPVDYDHEAYLGNTLTAIAGEKAGILKPGVPLIMSPQHPEAEAVILSRAAQLGCSVIKAAEQPVSQIDISARETRFTLDNDGFVCPLAGKHQLQNAITAVLACLKLNIAAEAIQKGLAQTRWPGRLEFVQHNPDVVLDGAHNPAGARALAAYIQEFCAGRPVWLVYGAMRDKAVEEVTGLLFPLASKLILTAPDFPRALRPEAIAEMTDHPDLLIAPVISDAVELIRPAPPEAVIFFTGSLFVVGEARARLCSAGDTLASI